MTETKALIELLLIENELAILYRLIDDELLFAAELGVKATATEALMNKVTNAILKNQESSSQANNQH